MPYKDIKDMTSDELLEFKAYIDSESAKVKDQLMVAKSTGAATGQYLPIPEYANLLSKKSYYAKKSQQIQTLMGRKKKLEKQERGIVGAELVIANLKAENARLRQNVDTVEQQSARIAELEAQLAEANAEIGRLRERNQNAADTREEALLWPCKTCGDVYATSADAERCETEDRDAIQRQQVTCSTCSTVHPLKADAERCEREHQLFSHQEIVVDQIQIDGQAYNLQPSICPRCGGSGIEPEPKATARPRTSGGFDCYECGGNGKVFNLEAAHSGEGEKR